METNPFCAIFFPNLFLLDLNEKIWFYDGEIIMIISKKKEKKKVIW